MGSHARYGSIEDESQDTEGGGYEEFFGGTLPCPSCRGSGRIPRESERELVALIPVRDKRLKPSKTKWYVSLAVVICLVLGGLLMFFLYPRNVTLSATKKIDIIPSSLRINVTLQCVWMGLNNSYFIENQNFYGITIDKVETQVFFDRKIMSDVTNKTDMYVGPRSKGRYFMGHNLTFSGDEGYIAQFCNSQSKYGHTLIMPFQTTVYVHLMGRLEEITLTSYEHVRCSPDLITTTTVTPATIVATTTTQAVTSTSTHDKTIAKQLGLDVRTSRN